MTYDAHPEQVNKRGARVEIQFSVMAPQGMDNRFVTVLDRSQFQRLQTDSGDQGPIRGVGETPVRRNSGAWEIAWDRL